MAGKQGGGSKKIGRSQRGAYKLKTARQRARLPKRKRLHVARSLGLLGPEQRVPTAGRAAKRAEVFRERVDFHPQQPKSRSAKEDQLKTFEVRQAKAA